MSTNSSHFNALLSSLQQFIPRPTPSCLLATPQKLGRGTGFNHITIGRLTRVDEPDDAFVVRKPGELGTYHCSTACSLYAGSQDKRERGDALRMCRLHLYTESEARTIRYTSFFLARASSHRFYCTTTDIAAERDTNQVRDNLLEIEVVLKQPVPVRLALRWHPSITPKITRCTTPLSHRANIITIRKRVLAHACELNPNFQLPRAPCVTLQTQC